MNNVHAKRATQFGLFALIMWMVEPLLISEINRLPIFECLSIVFASSFVMTAVRLTVLGRWKSVLLQPWFIWVAGVIFICGSDFAYIFGTQLAPVAHVDLIDYLWPCFVIGFVALLPQERFHTHHMVGAVLGILGIYVLIAHDISETGLKAGYLFGYLLSFIGAALWGGYCAFSRYHRHTVPIEMIGMYCGVGALLCLGLHFQFETFVTPTFEESSLSILTGMTGAGLAYQLWDYGIKHGNIYLLSILTYAARLSAMVLLVAFGKEPYSLSLVVACILASLGVFISSMQKTRLKTLWRRLKGAPKESPADDKEIKEIIVHP